MTTNRFGGVSLDKLLLERLGRETYPYYRQTLDHHYWQWKYHRVCDQASLEVLRLMLYKAGAVTLLREGGWRIDRSAQEYASLLGLTQENPTDNYNERFSGLENPSDPQLQVDSGPGNCTALYQMARPGWMMCGMADALLFSADGTLKNCLHEELQVDSRGYLTAYKSATFYRTLKMLEIWSVAEFIVRRETDASQDTDHSFSEPFLLLLPQGVESATSLEWQSLIRAHELAKRRIESHKKRFEKEGKELLTATMLGFLIDELVARAQVPNGMEFWYEYAVAALQALSDNFDMIADHVKKVWSDWQVLERMVRSLLADARRFSIESNPRQVFQTEWIRSAEYAADHLRTVGIVSRKKGRMNTEEADLVFTASNEIRRWVFFLEQRELFLAGKLGGDSREHRELLNELILRWLRRPWGIVRIKDIEMAFRGLVPGDEEDVMPRAFSALKEFLTTELEDYLVSGFKFRQPKSGMQSLGIFISRRLALHTIRHEIREIRHDTLNLNEMRERAHVLIDLFVMWLYDSKASDRIDQVETHLSNLIEEWQSGDWLRQYLAERQEEFPLTRRQEQIAQRYLAAPGEVTSKLFRVDEPGFSIERCIDTYPPEYFEFVSL